MLKWSIRAIWRRGAGRSAGGAARPWPISWTNSTVKPSGSSARTAVARPRGGPGRHAPRPGSRGWRRSPRPGRGRRACAPGRPMPPGTRWSAPSAEDQVVMGRAPRTRGGRARPASSAGTTKPSRSTQNQRARARSVTTSSAYAGADDVAAGAHTGTSLIDRPPRRPSCRRPRTRPGRRACGAARPVGPGRRRPRCRGSAAPTGARSPGPGAARPSSSSAGPGGGPAPPAPARSAPAPPAAPRCGTGWVAAAQPARPGRPW